MNYKNIYLKLCERGKSVRTLEYSESHHIIPRCMGGDDSDNNLTTLTAKEHYIAHLLLTKIYDEVSLLYAFGMMKNNTNKNKRCYTSSQYDKMKQSYSKAMKQNNPMFNEVTRRKLSSTRKEMFRNGTLTPTVFSDEVKRQISQRMMGDNNPIRKDPSRNRTAQPIRVHFLDGKIEEYSYAKEYCLKSGLSYATMKHMLKNNVGCKKHNILRIERI